MKLNNQGPQLGTKNNHTNGKGKEMFNGCHTKFHNRKP
uniref:Uncharacterized protein n=1 Tax=Rhizophora mucronata TaxID=61149 RepID=A0A2P2PBK8_RHIMU